MIELELTYEQLYKLYGSGDHEVPYKVTDEIYVRTPTGFTKINEVVTKHNNEVIRLDFDDGDKFECSVNHIFNDYQTGTQISAIDAREITSTYGKKTVVEKTPLGIENVYDISIDAPHWYISNKKSGIYHHNTFFSLAVVKNFLNTNPDGYCLYFDTEAAITKSLLESRGIDLSRVIVLNVVTIEEFRSKALKAVDIYLKKDEKERKPCLFVLDSLGMLSTNIEIGDAIAGEEKKDMTKAGLIKGAFRMLTLKLGQANIPMIVTNHLYANVGGYGPSKVQSGGCLTAGTKVFTRAGFKPIEKINVDDYVFTKEGTFERVLQTHQFKNKKLLKIEFEDGYCVTCTPEHKFLIDGNWIEAKNLASGDSVSAT
jgi:hypothetical protein